MKSLLQSENNWITSMGAWFAGERVVFRGRDLHHQLRDMSWMELYLFSITDREFTEDQLKILNAIWTFTSYPDPRIWPNRIAALAGTARSTPPLAMISAMAVSEAELYGHGPNIRALDFYLRLQRALDEGIDITYFVKIELQERKTINGYGRPVVKVDERVPHFFKLLKELYMESGECVQLALKVEKLLQTDRQGLFLNAVGLSAAIAADLGLTVQQYHVFMIPSFLAGMAPCYLDAVNKPEATFYPLRCTKICYEGIASRKWV